MAADFLGILKKLVISFYISICRERHQKEANQMAAFPMDGIGAGIRCDAVTGILTIPHRRGFHLLPVHSFRPRCGRRQKRGAFRGMGQWHTGRRATRYILDITTERI